jgi:hypothetical protein
MFGGDPFDPFNHMRRQMDAMDRMMNDPFGGMMGMNNMMNQMLGSTFGHQPMIGFDPRHPHAHHSHHQQAPPRSSGRHRDPMAMDLFDGFGGFGFGGGLMRVIDHANNDPNSMVFSQSTMITMNPDGTQRVISNSTRKAGDVKETRHAVRDGEQERIAVGHHIGDKTHLIEKKRDKDGKFRQQHKFINLDQDEADRFNHEFKTRASRNMSGIFGGGRYEPDRHAIEGARSSGSRSSNVRSSEPKQSGSSAPIITIPDDEEEEIPRSSRPSRHNSYLRASGSGPTIREISDEEAAADERSKRRKGTFGKFFTANDD